MKVCLKEKFDHNFAVTVLKSGISFAVACRLVLVQNLSKIFGYSFAHCSIERFVYFIFIYDFFVICRSPKKYARGEVLNTMKKVVRQMFSVLEAEALNNILEFKIKYGNFIILFWQTEVVFSILMLVCLIYPKLTER